MPNYKPYNKIPFINCSNMTSYEQTLFELDLGLGRKFVVVDEPIQPLVPISCTNLTSPLTCELHTL